MPRGGEGGVVAADPLPLEIPEFSFTAGFLPRGERDGGQASLSPMPTTTHLLTPAAGGAAPLSTQ